MFESVIQLFKNTSNFGVVFETYEVAKVVLKLLDENTNIRWADGSTPYKNHAYFEEETKNTILHYSTSLTYGDFSYYKANKTAQKDFPVIYFLSSSGELRNVFSPQNA